jgi:hypothetical protein
MAPATWKVGTITVPGSTGSQSITGLGGTPAAVFFLGTNWLTEDSSVTSTGTGVFRGMAAPKYDAPSTTLENAASITIAGDAHYEENIAILMLKTSVSGLGDVLYSAAFSSFDGDGFTVNFNNVTAGGYKVVYVALMDVASVGAFRGVTNQSGLSFGFKAGASLLHGAWQGPQVFGNDRTQEFFGGAAYPGTSSLGWMSAGMAAGCFPTSASQQYVNDLTLDAPSTRVATGMHFTGPFLITSNITAVPTGGGLTNLTFQGDSDDAGMIVAWDDEDSATGSVSIPANTGNTTTVSGLSFAPGLVMFYSVSDEPQGQGTGGRGAAGFGIATKNFQWCSLVDGVSSRGAFQSFQRGFVDCVNGSNVHAGTVELTADGFILTTEEDDASGGSLIWHAFGHPSPTVSQWIPHIYRRVQG